MGFSGGFANTLMNFDASLLFSTKHFRFQSVHSCQRVKVAAVFTHLKPNNHALVKHVCFLNENVSQSFFFPEWQQRTFDSSPFSGESNSK